MDTWHIIFQKLEKILDHFIETLPMIVAAIVIILLTFGIAKLGVIILKHSLKKLHLRISLIEVFKKLFSVVVWIFGLLIACATLFPSVTIGNLFTALGLGTLAIGFAFKDIFENFLAGILILVRETFLLNDYIKCENHEGRVLKITIRDTHIRQSDGERVVIPNAYLFKNPVTVVTDLKKHRSTIYCSVTSDIEVDKVAKLLQETLLGVETVMTEEEVQIFAHKIGGNYVEFEITWWTKPSPKYIRESRHKVIAAIIKELDKEKIELPNLYTTISFKDELVVLKNEQAAR